MDAEHDALTPEWRPQSRASGTTDSLSIALPARLLVPGKRFASPSSSDRSRVLPAAVDPDVIQAAQDIAPRETSICDRLAASIQNLLHPPADEPTSDDAALSFVSLEEALRYASVCIRYNAKWFAEPALSALLDTALDAASSSNASAQLFAAVDLVESTVIYSMLPSQSIPAVAKFLSQTYYASTRAYKTNKLAEATWTAIRHVLKSHVGDQLATAILEIAGTGDETVLESRSGYAQFAGALMIVSNKLLVKDATSPAALPTVGMTQLVDALWAPVVNGTDSVRETVMETLIALLADDVAVRDLDASSSWDVLLVTVEPCVTLTPESTASKSLVELLISRADHFESRNLPVLAVLAIDLNVPLTAQLAGAILPIWEEVLPTRDIPNAFFRILTKLCRSSHYTVELNALMERSILEIFLRLPEYKKFAAFIHTVQDLAVDPSTTDQAADTLATALVLMFRNSVRFAGREREQGAIFQALCHMSLRCVAAAEAMFRIRADVDGAVYVESGLQSQTFPLYSDSPSMSAVMHDGSKLPLHEWHDVILTVLQGCVEWKIYDYFLAELPSLLGNHAMFEHRVEFLKTIAIVVSDLLDNGVYPEPPPDTGHSKSYVTVRLLEVLMVVLSYHHHLSRQATLGLVSTFLGIAGSRDYMVSMACIHGLTLCCYELPDLVTSYMDDIIDKMSKLVTQRFLAIHVLLFLAGLSRQPRLFHNFQTHDFKKIFGVCGSYLQSIRGTTALTAPQTKRMSDQGSKTSATSSDALPQYVYALAHHVLAFWYMALKPSDREVLKEYITSCLKYAADDGSEIIEDQGLVTIDLMDRVDATELEHHPHYRFEDIDGRTVLTHRLAGFLLITTETALRTGKTILTVRRATGTESGLVDNPGQDKASRRIAVTVDGDGDDTICIFAPDVSGCTYGKIYIPRSSSPLGSDTTLTLPPNDDGVTRAIQQFDRTSALDSHKAGIIFIGEGQTTEDEILQNRMGSPDYVQFVMNLGNLVRLKGATFNTQGLDHVDDADGQHTIVWQNNLTELVFHVTTFMPTTTDDDGIALNTANKKKHIGNDYVNIVFNNSGAPFKFDTFPSQFNFVYIVIAPAARCRFIQTRTSSATTGAEAEKEHYYSVQVLTRPGYPAVSSAAEERIIGATSLAEYVRNLALNECNLSVMWAYRDEMAEYPSSWRSRLQQIRRLWERYG